MATPVWLCQKQGNTTRFSAGQRVVLASSSSGAVSPRAKPGFTMWSYFTYALHLNRESAIP